MSDERCVKKKITERPKEPPEPNTPAPPLIMVREGWTTQYRTTPGGKIETRLRAALK